MKWTQSRILNLSRTVFSVYEKIQLTGFSIQESIIAGIYIWEASRTLKPILEFRGPKEKKIIQHLILVNVLVVAMDASLLVTEFTNNFEIQTTYKTVVYSIKLKLEFFVLNQLLLITQYPTCTCTDSFSFIGHDIDISNCRLRPLRPSTMLQRSRRSDTTASSQFRLERIHGMPKGNDRQPSDFCLAGRNWRSDSSNSKHEIWAG